MAVLGCGWERDIGGLVLESSEIGALEAEGERGGIEALALGGGVGDVFLVLAWGTVIVG